MLSKGRCPVCRRNIEVQDGLIVTHGPGAQTLTCPGSRKPPAMAFVQDAAMRNGPCQGD